MQTFQSILKQATKRKGGKANLEALLPSYKSQRQLAKVDDARFLAMMTKIINQAGFSWRVIEKKWPEFEQAFFDFNLKKLSLLSPEQWEAYAEDRRVVRNWQKIKTVRENLSFVLSTAQEHGSFAKFIAAWPCQDQVGLMRHLKQHGSRLGGQSAGWFLRAIGKDCFILTKDVVFALQNAGLDIKDQPTSQRDLKKIQDCFNEWHQTSAYAYSAMSKILACSVGTNTQAKAS